MTAFLGGTRVNWRAKRGCVAREAVKAVAEDVLATYGPCMVQKVAKVVLDEDTHERLRVLSAQLDRSVSGQLRALVREATENVSLPERPKGPAPRVPRPDAECPLTDHPSGKHAFKFIDGGILCKNCGEGPPAG